MNPEPKSNKMGTMPIPKLIITMSLPAILSMMVQAMYNVVDSIFVSRIGENALTAVSLAFPIQLILIACFVGLGVGINSLISRKIGEKDIDSATNAAEHGFMLGAILYGFVVLVAVFFVDNYFKMFTEDATIYNYGVQYSKIILIFAFGRILAQAGMSMLQGTGEMIKPMKAQLIGAISNIILDPILIFGLFGFPRLEVRGAAIATVTAQIISMIYIFIVIFKGKNYIKLDLKKFKYSKSITGQILIVGLPVAIIQGLVSVMLGGLNLILTGFSSTSVAVLGVYYRLQSFVFMPVFGISQGTMPVIGFNYGAKNKERIIHALKFGLTIAIAYMSLGMLVFQLFPVQLLGLFKSTDYMVGIGVDAFRTISISFPLAACTIMLGTAFHGMGKAYISLIVSFVRQIVVILPTAYFLGKVIGLRGVWYGFVIAEVIGLLIAVYAFRRIYKATLEQWKIVADQTI